MKRTIFGNLIKVDKSRHFFVVQIYILRSSSSFNGQYINDFPSNIEIYFYLFLFVYFHLRNYKFNLLNV